MSGDVLPFAKLVQYSTILSMSVKLDYTSSAICSLVIDRFALLEFRYWPDEVFRPLI